MGTKASIAIPSLSDTVQVRLVEQRSLYLSVAGKLVLGVDDMEKAKATL